MDNIVVAAAQFLSVAGDKEKNYTKMEQLARQAKSEHNADLVLFPEICLTGGGATSHDGALAIAEEMNGEYVKKLQDLSAELDMDIAFGMLEKDGDKCYNDAVLCEPDGKLFWYRKVHLPHIGIDCHTDRGDEFPVFDTRFGKIGMIVCYDLRFPEITRSMALDGARLILVASCMKGSPKDDGAERVIKMLVRARALENRVYVLYSNWVGMVGDVACLGLSHLADPRGDILQQADGINEGIIAQSIDLSVADNKDILAPWGDVYIFKDRHPECYRRIVQP